MDPKLVSLLHDLDECRHADGVCKVCLVDMLATALNETLADVGANFDEHLRQPRKQNANVNAYEFHGAMKSPQAAA